MSDRPLITVRPATADDMRLVKASWYESYRRGGFAPEIGSDFYHAGHAKVIDDIIARPNVKVLAAAVTEIPDEVCAWLAYERDVIHYVYAKQVYRHMKIALELIRMAGSGFKLTSHMTRGGKRMAQFLQIRYNPYLQFHPPK